MISAVVLTKNEEKNIVDCLETLLWCDEIIIIDDYSTDMTLDAVQSLNNPKVNIYKKKLENDFSTQRNFGLSKAKGDWIFFVDTDEQIPHNLQKEIRSLIDSDLKKAKGYYVIRKDIAWGKMLDYGETGQIRLMRLAQKNSGLWRGKIHETWNIKGKKETLSNYLVHHPHESVREFLSDINRYSSVRADELIERKTSVLWWMIVVFPIGKFLVNYVIKRGFRDGVQGLIYAIMMSFHSFLVRSKVWLHYRRKENK